MRKLVFAMGLAIVVTAVIPSGVSAQFNRRNDDDRWNNSRNSDPRSGVCIYEDRDFRGRFECFDAGDEVSDMARMGNWNDKVSSIRVFGRDRINVFRDIHYYGERITIDRDISDLRQLRHREGSWDNQISSLFIPGGRGRGRGRF